MSKAKGPHPLASDYSLEEAEWLTNVSHRSTFWRGYEACMEGQDSHAGNPYYGKRGAGGFANAWIHGWRCASRDKEEAAEHDEQ